MQSDKIHSIQVTPSLVRAHIPHRPIDGHKGVFGSLSIRVGSLGMGGASLLCGQAALHSGVGLVRFVSEEKMLLSLMTACPEAISEQLPAEVEQRIRLWRFLIKKTSAITIGPGLKPEEPNILQEIIFLVEHAPRLVLDAGAISVVSRYPEKFDIALQARKNYTKHPVVLTPHPGECARLISGWNKSDRARQPLEYAYQKGVVLVLKGHQTAVFTPKKEHYLNSTGNNGLAKAGSGDVLAGIIGGFLAQDIDEDIAAFSGVYFHGLAGDIIAESKGARAMQPTDLFEALPDAYATCGWK